MNYLEPIVYFNSTTYSDIFCTLDMVKLNTFSHFMQTSVLVNHAVSANYIVCFISSSKNLSAHFSLLNN